MGRLWLWVVLVWLAPVVALGLRWDVVAFALAVMGLVLDVGALDGLLARFRWRKFARAGSIAEHVAILGAVIALVAKPPAGGWSRDTLGGPDMVVFLADSGRLLAMSGDHLHVRDGASWLSLHYPGPEAWIAGEDSALGTWVVPREGHQLYLRTDVAGWRAVARPRGHVTHAAAFGDQLLIVIQNALWAVDGKGHAEELLSYANNVAVDGQRIWAASRGVVRSDDGGHSWKPVGSGLPRLLGLEASQGRLWLFQGGVFRGHLWTLQDGRFVERPLPSPNVCAVRVSPGQPDEVWLGIWDGGVYRSTDDGRTWHDEGLQGVAIDEMALDPSSERVWVASGNMLFHRGLYWRHL